MVEAACPRKEFEFCKRFQSQNLSHSNHKQIALLSFKEYIVDSYNYNIKRMVLHITARVACIGVPRIYLKQVQNSAAS